MKQKLLQQGYPLNSTYPLKQILELQGPLAAQAL